jgi:hypothetical protein
MKTSPVVGPGLAASELTGYFGGPLRGLGLLGNGGTRLSYQEVISSRKETWQRRVSRGRAPVAQD